MGFALNIKNFRLKNISNPGSSLMQTRSFCVGLDREMQVAQNLPLNPAQSSPFVSHSTQGLGVYYDGNVTVVSASSNQVS